MWLVNEQNQTSVWSNHVRAIFVKLSNSLDDIKMSHSENEQVTCSIRVCVGWKQYMCVNYSSNS